MLAPLQSFGEDMDGLFVRSSQDIPSEFLDECRETRDASSAPLGNYHKVASVPTVLADKWLAEGFDIYRETPRAIVARLKAESLDAFVTTNRKV